MMQDIDDEEVESNVDLSTQFLSLVCSVLVLLVEASKLFCLTWVALE